MAEQGSKYLVIGTKQRLQGTNCIDRTSMTKKGSIPQKQGISDQVPIANVYINNNSRSFYIVSLKQHSSSSEGINAVILYRTKK